MVYFVCMACQETIKRTAVDKHCLRCRDCWELCCIDCNKVFEGEAFRAHVTCISEAEKYQGKLYKPKGGGKVTPQMAWMETLSKVAGNPPAGLSRGAHSLLGGLGRMESVPRKQKKFLNICRNSFRSSQPAVIEELWNILSKAFEENRSKSIPTKAENGSSSNQQEKSSAAESTATVRDASANSNNASTEEAVVDKTTKKKEKFSWRKNLKRIMAAAPDNSLPTKKARKKLFKVYKTMKPAQPLSKEAFKEKFRDKFSESKSFLFSDDKTRITMKK